MINNSSISVSKPEDVLRNPSPLTLWLYFYNSFAIIEQKEAALEKKLKTKNSSATRENTIEEIFSRHQVLSIEARTNFSNYIEYVMGYDKMIRRRGEVTTPIYPGLANEIYDFTFKALNMIKDTERQIVNIIEGKREAKIFYLKRRKQIV